MNDDTTMVLVIGILIILLINVTRITWKVTETGINYAQIIACEDGGGEAVTDVFNGYFGCENK